LTPIIYWKLSDFLGQSPLEPGETISKDIVLRVTQSGDVQFEARVVGHLFENTTFPGGGSYPYFAAQGLSDQLEIPRTYMDFDPGMPLELIRSVMFWVMYIESSNGNFHTYQPSGVPCTEFPPADQSWGNNGNISALEHCADFRYMYAYTMLNGMLNYERSPLVDHTDTGYSDLLSFGYFSNFGGSIWLKRFPLWLTLAENFDEDNCPNLTFTSGYESYENAFDVGDITSNWQPAILWLHEHLE
jgi:hypothetical protein